VISLAAYKPGRPEHKKQRTCRGLLQIIARPVTAYAQCLVRVSPDARLGGESYAPNCFMFRRNSVLFADTVNANWTDGSRNERVHMNRPMFWSGVALIAVGTAIFLVFVLPWIGGRETEAALMSGHAASGPSALAVAVASFGLAAGSALLGIGLGKWRRPTPSPHDGSPEA
jgi:hypothetical protein